MSPSTVRQEYTTLAITSANGECNEYRIDDGRSIFLGSSPDCGIYVDDQDLAPRHCLVMSTGGEISIQNWSSSTGTYVNGVEIDSRIAIESGDRVQIGNSKLSIKSGSTATVTDPVEVTEQSDMCESNLDEVNIEESVEPTEPIADIDNDETELDTIEVECVDVEVDEIEISMTAVEIQEQPIVDSGWGDFVDDESHESDETMQYDQETVDLLKAEIDDLRSMLAISETSVGGANASSCGGISTERTSRRKCSTSPR